jgi:ABC transport system ATP-binding/permease protein
MNVLSLDGVSKTLVDTPLFEQVTLGIDAGEKIGFIGRNGAGKSTFLRILSGALAPDEGTVSRNRTLTVSVLEQRPVFTPGMTLDEFCFSSEAPLGAERSAVGDAFHSLCRELGLDDPAARLDGFSGGMLRKASLARCLSRGALFLMLDEPTNHLDLETIEWLEARLLGTPSGFILVTHDRYFLDEVCTAIMEIEGRRIRKYPGNYAEYLERRAEREQAEENAEQRRSTILRRELEWLKRGPRARTGKDKGRKRRIQETLAARPGEERTMQEFSSARRRLGKKVLELNAVTKGYGARPVISEFSHSFRRGERLGLIGPNGSGKTTFLRLVSGEIAPDAGTAVKGETTVFGHLAQAGGSADPLLTVLNFMKELAERVPQPGGGSLTAEQFLERFLFPRSMHGVTLDLLSGGELRRLTMVRLLATAPNFLLLDEPTNDLDLDAMRQLEDYLSEFEGCILLVSHDRAMLDRLADSLLVFDGEGGIRGFTGTYEEYREDAAAHAASAARPAREQGRLRPARQEKAGLSFRERREYEELLAQIDELEKEQKALEAGFLRPSSDQSERQKNDRRYREIAGLLEARMARWEELAARGGE